MWLKLSRGCLSCCCAGHCCAVLLLALGGLLRLAVAAAHGCEMLEAGVHPATPELFAEWPWLLAHFVGIRAWAEPIRWFVPHYSRVQVAAGPTLPPAGPRCALTVDDAVGGNATGLLGLLDVLERHGVLATFFVIADDNTTRDEGQRLLQRVAAQGHEIGNHGLTDAPMTDMSRGEFESALLDWESTIRNILPRWPVQPSDRKWFRPPLGLMSPAMAAVLEERGYGVVLGDVWSADVFIEDTAFHARIMETATCDGSIIVVHTPGYHPATQQCLDIVEAGVPGIQGRGFTFVRLTELFAGAQDRGGVVWCGFSVLCVGSVLVALLAVLLSCSFCSIRCLHCSARLLVLSWAYRCGAAVAGSDDVFAKDKSGGVLEELEQPGLASEKPLSPSVDDAKGGQGAP